jgi:hypothetical protein
MELFLPHYLNFDLSLPTEYHYRLGLFIDALSLSIHWSDIQYGSAELDIEDIKFDFTRGYDIPLLKVDLPALKHWEIKAHQEVNAFFIPFESDVSLEFADFDVDFNTDLKLDSRGYIDPSVYDIWLNFGDTYLHHDDWFVAWVMHQIVYLLL